MSLVLDTNVVSELMRPSPDAAVSRWFGDQQPRRLRTTAITVAEIGYGLARLPRGRRRERLIDAAAATFAVFSDQVLSFDVRAASLYPDIVRAREAGGRPISGFDAQIAAICRVDDHTLVTRNVADFADTGVSLIDPWRG